MAQLRIKTGSEGPRHDPYSWTEIHFTKTGSGTVVLRSSALGYDRLYMNGQLLLETYEGREASNQFRALTGLTPEKAEKIYYERLYVEDPFGHPSRYM